MDNMLGLYLAIFGMLLIATVVRSRLANHILLGITGAAGVVYGAWAHGALAIVLPSLILVVAGVQAASILMANKSATFTDEEQALLDGPLSKLGRAQARRLLDQGVWMDCRSGDVLTREGQPAGQLYYLASGAGEVHSQGHLVGRVGAGQLIGEATVLGEAAAIATVSLTERSRVWCAQGQSLNAFLAANPDARHALEHSFTVSLRQKLAAMNKAVTPA